MTASPVPVRTVGEFLRYARAIARLSRNEVAARAGVGSGTVSRLEADYVPAVRPELADRVVVVLADELDVDRDAALGYVRSLDPA